MGEGGFDNPVGRSNLQSMRAVAIEQFSVADYRAMPEGPPYYQLVEGELIMALSPSSFHQEIAKPHPNPTT